MAHSLSESFYAEYTDLYLAIFGHVAGIYVIVVRISARIKIIINSVRISNYC